MPVKGPPFNGQAMEKGAGPFILQVIEQYQPENHRHGYAGKVRNRVEQDLGLETFTSNLDPEISLNGFFSVELHP
ncbi:hypothetical protein ULO1_11370 [Carboxydocella sp. ULO1]|nr:hypothetical protein ULO1_11370 [Carboxydocella sp. ULO1]